MKRDRTVPLPDVVWKMVGDPDEATLKDIWKAIPEAARKEHLGHLLTAPPFSDEFAELIADDLKGIRPTALRDNPDKYISLLMNNPALYKHLQYVVGVYLGRSEFRYFVPSITADAEEEGAPTFSGGPYRPGQVGPTASMILAKCDPVNTVLCLLGVRVLDSGLRDPLDSWFHHLRSDGLGAVIDEGERLLEENGLVDPEAPPQWDPDTAEERLEDLESQLVELRKRLTEAVNAIEEESVIPDPALTGRIEAVDGLYRELTELMGLEPAAGEKLPEMRELNRERRTLLHHSKDARRIASLVISLAADNDLLAPVRSQAEAIRTAIDQGQLGSDHTEDVERIAAGRHPMVDILRLTLVRDGLGRDEIQEASNRIEAEYGRTLQVDILSGQVSSHDDLVAAFVEIDRSLWQMLSAKFSAERPPLGTGSDVETAESSTDSDQPVATDSGVSSEVVSERDQQRNGARDHGPRPDQKTSETRKRPSETQEDLPSEVALGAPTPDLDGESEGIMSQWALRRSPKDTAEAIRLAKEPGEIDPLLEELVIGLAAEGEFALARQLYVDGGDLLTIPSWLLNALALAPHLKTSVGAIESALRECFALFTPDPMELSGDWERGLSFLHAAAALRPALLAPTSLAFTALERLHFPAGMEKGYALCEKVKDHSVRGRYLDRTVLSRALDVAAKEEVLEDIRLDAEQWLRDAPRRKLLYAGATDVWRHWNQEGGVLFHLLDPVRRDDRTAVESVRGRIQALSTKGAVSDIVNRTWADIRSASYSRDIEARALRQIENRTDDAKAIAQRWVDYHETEPGRPGEQRIRETKRLHQELSGLLDGALGEVQSRDQQTDLSLLEGTGLSALTTALEDLAILLSNPESLSGAEPDPLQVRNSPLLRVPAVILDPDWEVLTPESEVRERVVEAVADGLPPLGNAYERRLELHDHVGAHLIIDVMRGSDEVSPDEIAQLEEDRTRRMRQTRAALRIAAESTREKIERAVMQGLLTETERASWMAPVDRAERLLEREQDGPFRPLFEELRPIGNVLEQKRDQRLQGLQERIKALADEIPEAAVDRIGALMEQGDVFTAEEFIGILESGRSLPQEADALRQQSPFEGFFPEVVTGLEDGNLGPKQQIPDKMRSRQAVGPISLEHLPDGELNRAADVLEQWFRAARHPGNPVKDLAESVFRLIGFNVQEVAVTDPGRQSWVEVATDPVRDRARCPVPLFGSVAAGGAKGERAHYRVLWLWDELSADDLLAAVGDTANAQPTFVFYLNRLGEKRRRSLARLSRERRRTFLVIDDDLLLRLVAEVDARMPLFYALTLPFTYLEPYVTTAGDVPPELFFGRDSERREIIDTAGSSFVYGGRQLGKTALLRHVERFFDAPDQGQIAIFVDLIAQGIGIAREPDNLWPILVNEFRDLGVIDSNVRSHAGPEAIQRHVERWLDQDGRRRILVLLDEADKFFEADRDFQTVSHLKGLMDQTNRRFKVVFSGLHNVQRMTRISNNPLVHLGRPIVIGPLYMGEWSEARGLLQEPLEALGFRFESPELLTRLLSHTNYFPSLIQLTGRYLLRRLTRANVEVFDPAKSPPYVITREHVDDVARDPDLRNELRNRFLWTLDLDKRYRLIAFVLAERSLRVEHGDAALSPAEVRRLVLDWWPKGFEADSSEDVMRVLLDEMVDLRVLRRTSKGKYALLNENIVLLLGTEREIEEELINMQDEEPLPAFEPAMHRRIPRKGDATVRRSPLTSEQEGRLIARSNGVAVVFGSHVSGLDEVEAFLEDAPQAVLETADQGVDLEAFEDLLAKVVQARVSNGVTTLVVPDRVAWTSEWTDLAHEKTQRLSASGRWLRVIFLANPARTWEFLDDAPSLIEAGSGPAFDMVSLRPWDEAMVARWLDSTALPASTEILNSLRELTGFWPMFLYEAHQYLREGGPGGWKDALEDFGQTWGDKTTVKGRAAKFGLEIIPDSRIPALLTPEGETQERAIAETLEVPQILVRRTLAWLDRLRLAKRVGEDSWNPDLILSRVV